MNVAALLQKIRIVEEVQNHEIQRRWHGLG